MSAALAWRLAFCLLLPHVLAQHASHEGQLRAGHTGSVTNFDRRVSTADEQRPEPKRNGALIAGAAHYVDDTLLNDVEASLQPRPYKYELLVEHNWDLLLGAPGELPDERYDVVLATVTTPERLPLFLHQAALWNGPVSVAINLPLPMQHGDASCCRRRILNLLRGRGGVAAGLQDSPTGPSAPPLHVVLLYSNVPSAVLHCNISDDTTGLEEGVRDEQLWQQQFGSSRYAHVYQEEFPVSALKQLALDAVPYGRFVFFLDTDFMPPVGLSALLTEGSSAIQLGAIRRGWEMSNERHVMVIPAFELVPGPADTDLIQQQESACMGLPKTQKGGHCWKLGQSHILPSSMAALHAQARYGLVRPWQEVTRPLSQGCYSPWKVLEEGVSSYDMQYALPCEPFIVGLKDTLPPFDERWRGHGMDKMAYLAHVASWGTRFTVNPEVFVVHAPHGRDENNVHVHGDPRTMVVASFTFPFLLYRAMMRDVQLEPETVREVAPWVPGVDEGSLQAAIARDRKYVPRNKHKLSPWRPGLVKRVEARAAQTMQSCVIARHGSTGGAAELAASGGGMAAGAAGVSHSGFTSAAHLAEPGQAGASGAAGGTADPVQHAWEGAASGAQVEQGGGLGSMVSAHPVLNPGGTQSQQVRAVDAGSMENSIVESRLADGQSSGTWHAGEAGTGLEHEQQQVATTFEGGQVHSSGAGGVQGAGMDVPWHQAQAGVQYHDGQAGSIMGTADGVQRVSAGGGDVIAGSLTAFGQDESVLGGDTSTAGTFAAVAQEQGNQGGSAGFSQVARGIAQGQGGSHARPGLSAQAIQTHGLLHPGALVQDNHAHQSSGDAYTRRDAAAHLAKQRTAAATHGGDVMYTEADDDGADGLQAGLDETSLQEEVQSQIDADVQEQLEARNGEAALNDDEIPGSIGADQGGREAL